MLQLWYCLKRLSFLDHRQKRCVGGTEAFKQNHTCQEHEEKNHPCTDVPWFCILTLEDQVFKETKLLFLPVVLKLPRRLENSNQNSNFLAQTIQSWTRWHESNTKLQVGWTQRVHMPSKHHFWTPSGMPRLLQDLFLGILWRICF